MERKGGKMVFNDQEQEHFDIAAELTLGAAVTLGRAYVCAATLLQNHADDLLMNSDTHSEPTLSVLEAGRLQYEAVRMYTFGQAIIDKCPDVAVRYQ